MRVSPYNVELQSVEGHRTIGVLTVFDDEWRQKQIVNKISDHTHSYALLRTIQRLFLP